MPWSAWKAILKRTWVETTQDNIGLVAAGVAFYGFLAIVPLLAALVLTYGLVADGATVLRDIGRFADMLPPYAARFVGAQLIEVVQASDGKKGLGLIFALALALFGARNGAAALITALNIAYEENETRGLVHQTLLALAMTSGAVAVALLAVLAIASLGFLGSFLPMLPDALIALGKAVGFLAVALGGAAGAATLYRYGPNRARARWVWLTPGSLLAAAGWLGSTLGFGIYVANIDDYSATYGSLSAIVVMLSWLYLSSYILLLGAELNSEIEHQTARDTTEGPETPLGRRDAWAADHVASPDPEALDDHHVEPASTPLSDAPQQSIREVAPDGARAIAIDYARLRAIHRAERVIGVVRIGALPSALAATGLGFLRRRGRGRRGALLLAVAGALAWIGRRDAR